MARPVTLFTGQWADLPLAELAPLAKSMGYDGLAALQRATAIFERRPAAGLDDDSAATATYLAFFGLVTATGLSGLSRSSRASS